MTRRLSLIAALLLWLVVPANAQLIPGIDFGGAEPAAESEPAGETAADGEAALDELIDILSDDAARQALIEEIEARRAAGDPTEAAEAEEAPPALTLGARLAMMTQAAAEMVTSTAREAWAQVSGLPQTVAAIGEANYGRLLGPAFDLLVLALVTYGGFIVARAMIENLTRALRLRAARSGWLAALLATLMLALTNIVMVGVAWAVGNVVAVAFLGNTGQLGFHQSLYLNAFLIVEIALALIRALLAPKREDLRWLPISTEEAVSFKIWARITLSVLVYGQLLVVPLFNRFVGASAAQGVSVVLHLAVLALMVNLVLRIRERVTAWLIHLADDGKHDIYDLFARTWHIPVLVYLLALFAVVLMFPGWLLVELVVATAKILVAVFAGLLAAHLLTRIILSGVRLPERFSSRIPLLEQRINAFVPRALTVLRLVIVVVVGAVVLDSLGLFSLTEWLESEVGARTTTAVITVVGILLASFLAWLVLNSWVDFRLNPDSGAVVSSRERTLLVLMRNALSITIVVLALMFTLSEIGINIAPLLASAGVIGLAIGFGAQKLVQDIITGIFIQLEGAIDVGDVVDIGGISGSVERLTIRSAGLRDAHGVYHIVPFSAVNVVSNHMRGFAYHVADMSVAYSADLDVAKQAMFEAFDQLKANPDFRRDIVGELDWNGLNSFGPSEVVLRARIKTRPGKQWAVGRAYNALIKRLFDERGVEIPYPHQKLVFDEAQDQGRAALAGPRSTPVRRGRGKTTAPDPSDDTDDAGTKEDKS